jgi:hypothetical protein
MRLTEKARKDHLLAGLSFDAEFTLFLGDKAARAEA